mgnify:CR=1 FL=1
MEHQVISTSELYFSQDNVYLQKRWYKELHDIIDAGTSSYYEDCEVDPLWDNYMVKYSPDRKRLLGEMPGSIDKYDIKEGTEIIFGIGHRASDSLLSITIPDSVSIIMEDTFCGCEKLEEVILGDGLKLIGDTAFAGCCFQEIFIPRNVKIIGESCFCENDNLKGVYLPAGLEAISEDAFQDCESLTHIFVPKGSIEKFKTLLPENADLITEIEEAEWKKIESSKTYSGYALNHKLDNKWTAFRGKLISLDEEEENYEDPFINHYSEEDADNFYGMTDGMKGDLW